MGTGQTRRGTARCRPLAMAARWLALAIALTANATQAQEPAAEEQVNPMEVAREHMERGQALYQGERYIESAEEFLKAYEAQPFAAFLFNAGISYEKVGDPERASDYFSRYLKADPQAEDAADVKARIEKLRGVLQAREAALAAEAAAKAAEEGAAQTTGTEDPDAKLAQEKAAEAAAAAAAELETAKKRVAELEAQVAAQQNRVEDFKSLLSIQTQPADAKITVKDAKGQVAAQGQGPEFAETLDEGKYTVSVEHPDYKTISTPITIAPGKVYVVITEMSQGQFLGFLRVVTNVPGAKVFLDNKEEGKVGETPFANAISTGVHHVWIDKPGYKVVERDVEVGVGEDVTLRVDLTRLDHGRLRVVANRRDAEVWVDGERKGIVPLEVDVKGGTHRVTIKAPNMKDWDEDVVIRNGQLTPVRVRLRPAVGRAGAYVTAVLGALMIGGGITAGVMGKNLQDELNESRSQGLLVQDDQRILRGKILYISADVGYGLGAVLGGLAIYYFLRDPLPDSEAKVLEPRDWTFNPYAGPDGAGGQIGWSF